MLAHQQVSLTLVQVSKTLLYFISSAKTPDYKRWLSCGWWLTIILNAACLGITGVLLVLHHPAEITKAVYAVLPQQKYLSVLCALTLLMCT